MKILGKKNKNTKEKYSRKKILICGSFHGNNLGDIAILQSMIESLSGSYKLTVLSISEEVVREKIEVPGKVKFVSPFKVHELLKEIIKNDLVIIGGGGLFFDKGFFDILNFMKGSQIFVWWFITTFSRIFFKKVYWLGVGMGPLTKWGVLEIKMSLPFIENIHVRDKSSLKILEDKLNYKKAQKSADWVFLSTSYKDVKKNNSNANLTKDGTIGLCFKLSGSNNKKLDEKIIKIKSIISDLKREYPDKNFVLFSTNPLKDNTRMVELAKKSDVTFVDTSVLTLKEFKKFLSAFEIVISERMHALLMGFQLGVLGVGISEKINDGDGLGKVAEFQRELYSNNLYTLELSFDSIRKLVEDLIRDEKEYRHLGVSNYKHLATLASDNVLILE